MTDKEDEFFSNILATKLEDSPVPEDKDLPVPLEVKIEIVPEVVPVVTQEILPVSVGSCPLNIKSTQDIDYVTKNLHEIIDRGKEALDQLLKIAHASQHPRAYEVVSELIQSVTASNNQLIKIHQQAQEMEKNNNTINKKQVIENQNNVFVGSTAELFAIMKDIRNKK